LYVEGTALARQIGVEGYYVRIAPVASTTCRPRCRSGTWSNSGVHRTRSGASITSFGRLPKAAGFGSRRSCPVLVHWSVDNWMTKHDTSSRDTQVGVHVTDLPTETLRFCGEAAGLRRSKCARLLSGAALHDTTRRPSSQGRHQRAGGRRHCRPLLPSQDVAIRRGVPVEPRVRALVRTQHLRLQPEVEFIDVSRRAQAGIVQ
jgi:hypothetical protein